VLVAGFLAPAVASAQDASLAIELQRIRRDLSDLQSYVYSGKQRPRSTGKTGAPSQGGEIEAVSRMQVQMQSLESQIRDLTGRIEKVEHGVVSLTARFERMANDVETRFQALEQGGTGVVGTVTPQVGRTAAPTAKGVPTGQGNTQFKSGTLILGTLPRGGEAPKPKSAPASGRVSAAKPTTAKGQYDLAFDQLRKGSYDDAATGFKKFLDVYPEHALASNAIFWHGETYYVRKNYAEAARIFLDGYKRYPKGNKAPDSLYKLGRSLALINEKKSACSALKKMLKAFPNANPRLKRNTKKEIKNLRCS
jgi:tol-pal system protein YbgF